MKRKYGSWSNVMLAAGLIAVGGFVVSGGLVHAANIAWTAVVVDTSDDSPTNDPGTGLGDAAVSTVGTLVEAANFGILQDVTVNGVLFKGNNFTVLPTNLSIAYDSADNVNPSVQVFTGTSTGGNIDIVTKSFSRDTGVSMQNATLTNLTIGSVYQVQFLASFAGINRSTTFDDLNGNTIVQKTNNPHSFSTGFFTADATTQAIKMTVSQGSQFLSAYQLRVIPEPASLVLGAIGLVGSLLAGRRK